MRTLTIRGVPEEAIAKLKAEAAEHHCSMNKWIVRLLENRFSLRPARKRRHTDLDGLFGSMPQESFAAVEKASRAARHIDAELWQ